LLGCGRSDADAKVFMSAYLYPCGYLYYILVLLFVFDYNRVLENTSGFVEKPGIYFEQNSGHPLVCPSTDVQVYDVTSALPLCQTANLVMMMMMMTD